MTPTRRTALAGTNDDSRPAEPVTNWENRAVRGHALCADFIFRQHVEKTQALRDRQAAYLDSLPSDPSEAIHAALRAMHPGAQPYPEGLEEAAHLSRALEALVRVGDLDESCGNHGAAIYIAERVAECISRAMGAIDLAGDILRNPARIEREGRAIEASSGTAVRAT